MRLFFKTKQADAKRRKLFKRLYDAVMLDRTENLTRHILKEQMQGLSPEFLNYIP
ncbi:MAG: hypothetical protein IJP88_01190 [Synergistaceae bacterium]|nr:hypothetical protein [Synergistaceae bacterium]